MRRSTIVAAFLAIGLLASSCGADDDTSSAPSGDSADGSSQTDPGQPGTEAGSAGATAVVTVGETTYEMTSEAGCNILGADTILATFTSGADQASLTAAEGTVLVRMTLDGVDWVDSGGAPQPVLTDGGATWTGQVAEFPNGGATPADATIEMTC